MPPDRLATHVPGRPRSYRDLAFHLFRVVDAFLDTYEGTTLVQAMFAEEPAADADTAALVAFGAKVRQRLQRLVAPARRHAAAHARHLLRPAEPARTVRAHDLAFGPARPAIDDAARQEGVAHHRPLGDADFARCRCRKTSGTADRETFRRWRYLPRTHPSCGGRSCAPTATTAQQHQGLVKEIYGAQGPAQASCRPHGEGCHQGVSGALSAVKTKSKEPSTTALETAQAFIDDYSESAKEATEPLPEVGQLRDTRRRAP